MNKKEILLIITLIIYILMPFKVKAIDMDLNCPSKVNKNSNFNCVIHENNSENSIASFEANISFTSGINCYGFTSNAKGSTYINNRISIDYGNNYLLSNNDIGSILCKFGNINDVQTITLNNVRVGFENGHSIDGKINPSFIEPISDDATLSSLSINNGSLYPAFSVENTVYNVSVLSSSIVVYGKTNNVNAKIDGLGLYNLNYGENNITINVTAEAGNTKSYLIKINRIDNRNSDADLNNLTVSYGSINFTNNVTNYQVYLASNIESNTIIATSDNSKAKITFSPSKTVYLDYGETKTVNIVVTAENGVSKTYTITFTRLDERSTNNFLQSLSVDNYDFGFSNLKTSYVLEVDNEVSFVNINGVVEDSRSKVNGLGKTSLEVGSNIKKIIVTSENGTNRTYVLTIIRKNSNGESVPLSNNNYLNNLSIDGIDLNFNKNNLYYVIGVTSNINKININYVKEDNNAEVAIDGNNNLSYGENEINVIVTALDSSQRIYTLILNKYDENNIETNDLDVINDKINTEKSDISIITNNLKLNGSVLNNLKKSNKNLLLNIVNDKKGLLYSYYIKGNNINDENEFDTKINEINNDSSLKYLLSNNYLLLKHDGNFIKDTTLKILVNQYWNNNTILYLYGYVNGTLIPLNNDSIVNNGYVTFNLGNLSDFVITDELVNLGNNYIQQKKNASLEIVLPLFIIGSFIFYIKKRKNKLSK
jgi:hypothetical protein